MDYLQYLINSTETLSFKAGFKPYYKWITFNTLTKGMNVVFMLERSLFYMVAKFEHFSVIHGFLTFYIKFLLQFFCFFLK